MTQRGNLEVGPARIDTCKAIPQLSQANPQAANDFGDGVQIGVGRADLGKPLGRPFSPTSTISGTGCRGCPKTGCANVANP